MGWHWFVHLAPIYLHCPLFVICEVLPIAKTSCPGIHICLIHSQLSSQGRLFAGVSLLLSSIHSLSSLLIDVMEGKAAKASSQGVTA
ncbi:hypothetical protein BS50DRAFT_375565 [Corynespora cassiicola Philippines]|uniref:Major facilitator superfamily (MFS) profile domain-containing protein n=1 Tax=Corynespora cassiicola Philippines TaxID=1448308 RepID=A0A2T2NN95_CORCC|nr:hypothetical protein BS50DRAFT_375565 [Corynespora cassiicola Philippines]